MMRRTAVYSMLYCALFSCSLVRAQDPASAPKGPIAVKIGSVLERSGNGHSPTAEDVATAGADLTQDGIAVREALPLLIKALENADTPVRAYALTMLVGLESPVTAMAAAPAAAAADAAVIAPAGSAPVTAAAGAAAYNAELQKALAPAIPQIAAHLTDDSAGNRILTAAVLGGFSPSPPAGVYGPLIAYLKRDDAVSPMGQAVVEDLLQLGPLSDETAAAIARFMRRSDQTPDSRANLIDSVASHANQSQSLNKAVLAYLDSDDPTVRARLILTLPQLDLSAEVFADTRSRVSQLAANSSENLQVINAAKAVSPCWTAIRMASGCPVY